MYSVGICGQVAVLRWLVAAVVAIAIAPALAHAQPAVPPRPIAIVGGFSNCPAHFVGSPLVTALQDQRGANRVLLTTHADPWGDIQVNARTEAREIRAFLDRLPGVTEVDLVGFSMGGLIVRAIVLDHAAELGRYRVRNLITIGTPNHGAHPVITEGDPGWAIRSTECQGAGPPIAYNGTVAVRQMVPGSDLLRDLNARRIPASIRVTTIAGDIEADVLDYANAVGGALCNSNCIGVGPPIGVPEGGPLVYVDRWHGQCRYRAGGCQRDTVCPPLTDRFQDGGVWKCRARVATPTGKSHRVRLGSDGLIRVASVKLRPSEAAHIVAQHEVVGTYHTATVRARWSPGGPPRPLLDARNAAPTDVGTIRMGIPVHAMHFFEDPRVTAILLGLLSRPR